MAATPDETRTSRLTAVWVMVFGVALALLLAEGVLRLFPSLLPEEAQLRLLWRSQTSIKSTGDPDLGFLYPPYYSATIKSHDFAFHVESDEHGFRNPAPWPKKAGIVVLGDSMAYGWGVESAQSWVRILDRRMPGLGVITLGMPGTVPEQSVRYFERFGAGLQPKLVLFGIFPGNDFKESDTFQAWLAEGSPGNYDVWRFFGGKPPSRARSALKSSRLVLLIRTVLRSAGFAYSSETLNLADGSKLRLAPRIYDDALRRNDPQDPAFKRMVAAAASARRQVEEAGGRMIVILFPTKEAIYLPMNGQSFPSLTRPMKDVLQENGLHCIDLSDSFREGAQAGKSLFFEIDGHPNVAGNALIADVVERYIRRNGMLEDPAP